eukprot:scaffold15605_cov165-Amphora_coffeaeformis.AAC.2
MELKLATLCFLLLLGPGQAQDDDDDTAACSVGSITMAGAEGAEVIVQAWKEEYSKKCPDFEVETNGGGYPLGAARVCGNHPVYGAVDIGGMDGPFFYPQARTENEWGYDCKHSERKAILVSPC